MMLDAPQLVKVCLGNQHAVTEIESHVSAARSTQLPYLPLQIFVACGVD